LAKLSPVIAATFAEASGVLGYDLWTALPRKVRRVAEFDRMHQPALWTAGVGRIRLWRERGGKPRRR